MRIQHNILAMNAYRNYTNNTTALGKNLEKLSSGYKINRAGDDAAGLAISEKMRAQITGLQAAQKNVKDGISLVKTAEGAMQEIHDMLNRMDYLATQSANGTYDNEVDRLNLQKEIVSLKDEINRIADSANFNGIKLLDGSLDVNGELSITTAKPSIEQHMGVDGITVNTPENGGGSHGEFTITIDELFGDGDKLTIEWGKGSGFVAAGSDDASEGAADTAALDTQKTVLTFDKDTEAYTSLTAGTFTGTTKKEQAQSIADVLAQDSNISAQFDIKVVDDSIVLTNKNEGNDQATVSKVTATDASGNVNKTSKASVTDGSATAANGTTGTVFKFEDMVNNKDGMELQEGDTLTIKLTDSQGVVWTAKVTLSKDVMKGSNGDTVTAILNALNATDDDKAIYFEANDKTARAEEKIKFSDLFTASVDANTGGSAAPDADFILTAKNTNDIFQDGATGEISSDRKGVAKATTTSDDANLGAIAAGTYTLDLDAAEDGNYSRGDKVTIKGTLSDGSTFEVNLIAGEDFEIGAAKADTVDNIVAFLTSSKDTVDTKDEDGNVTGSVALKDIFSTGTGGEIKVEQATGALKFTSQVKGTKFHGAVTEADITPAKAGTLSSDLRNGVQKSPASASVSFSALEEGATVKVGDTTYQFVTDSANVEDGNTAIVVSDLSDAELIAKALEEQLKKDAGDTDPEYTVKRSGDTVTITTTAKGKDVAAPTIEAGTPSHEDVVFELQPNKLKTGSTITVNGKTFEFVNTAKNPDAEVGKDNIAVKVDLSKATAEEVNQAMVDALTEAGIGEVRLEDGKVKICNDGEEQVEVSFDNGKALTLQIGDTSDDFNQLSVSVGDMHTWAMDIDGIDIGSQDGAKAAIDVVKNAINYVSGVRGDLGAIQNRLEHTQNNLSVMAENIQDAESTIRDTDVADEMMAYTKNNILIQSAQAMLAQANQVPQGVLQLLQ